MDRCASGQRKVGVAFSGGVDSSVLVACAKRHTEVVACSAFADGSLDGRTARAAADALGVEMTAVRLTVESVAESLKAIDLPFEPSLMDRSLWSLYAAVARRGAEAGAGTLLLGQLADELFGGYAKYEKTLVGDGEEAARRLMETDVADYKQRGRVRDVGACARWLKPAFPYEDPEVRELGESMPVSFKIGGGVRKAVLRRAAAILGVPEELSMAPKKAAQYSSGIQKMVA